MPVATAISLEYYLGWNGTLPLSVKYKKLSGHVRVMYQETTSNMTRKQGISQGTRSKNKVKAPNQIKSRHPIKNIRLPGTSTTLFDSYFQHAHSIPIVGAGKRGAY